MEIFRQPSALALRCRRYGMVEILAGESPTTMGKDNQN